MNYWKERCEFMEDLLFGCGGSISDRAVEYIENNPEPDSNIVQPLLYEVAKLNKGDVL